MRKTFNDPQPSAHVSTRVKQDLTLPLVMHVGIHDDTIYYFGYTYTPIDKKELTKMHDRIDGALKDKPNASARKRLEAGLKYLEKDAPKEYIKKELKHIPKEHIVTNCGLYHVDDVKTIPKGSKLVHFEECIIAYERGVIHSMQDFINHMTKHSQGNTVYHIHTPYDKAVIAQCTDLKIHTSVERTRHVAHNLFGKVHNRLHVYNGDSFYKYIYDDIFWNPIQPWLFDIPATHVIVKADTANHDGYYNLSLMNYNTDMFEKDDKNEPVVYYEGTDMYNRTLKKHMSSPSFNRVAHNVQRPELEYVGASATETTIVRVGSKNPPRWLKRLLGGIGRHNSPEFLMCGVTEFFDQWHVLLLEHFDSMDYDISREFSPFMGHVGLTTLTGEHVLRRYTPRMLTMEMQQFLTGMENGTTYKHGGMGVYTESSVTGVQRSTLAVFNEFDINIPITTPLGEFLFVEGVNFPTHELWRSLKDNLIDFNLLTTIDPSSNMVHTGTELKTEDYSILWYSPFDSTQIPHHELCMYNDYDFKGVHLNKHEGSYDIPSTPNIINNEFREEVTVLDKRHRRSHYNLNATDSFDFNGVKFNPDDINTTELVDNIFGRAIKTNLYYKADDTDTKPISNFLLPVSVRGTINTSNLRNMHINYEYTKSSSKIDDIPTLVEYLRTKEGL